MNFQEEIRKQQLLDRINILKKTLPIPEKDASEPISKSLFDEFDTKDIDVVEKSLNAVGEMLGDEAVNDIEKAISHKYFKREGTKGNYKYYYTEADYKESKGDKSESNYAFNNDSLSQLDKFKVGLTNLDVSKLNSLKNDFEGAMSKHKSTSNRETNELHQKKLELIKKELAGKDSDKKEEKSEEEKKYLGKTISIGDGLGLKYTVTKIKDGLATLKAVDPKEAERVKSNAWQQVRVGLLDEFATIHD